MSQWFFQVHLTKTVPRSSRTASLRQLIFLLCKVMTIMTDKHKNRKKQRDKRRVFYNLFG